MTRLMIAAAAFLAASVALADTFTYKCKAKSKPSIVRIDDAKKTLSWQGKTYRLARELTNDECAKFGWRLEGNGDSGDFCTASQGVADISIGKVGADCNLKR